MSSIVPFEMRLVEFYAYRRKPPSAFDEYVFTAIFQSAIFPLTAVFFLFFYLLIAFAIEATSHERKFPSMYVGG